MSACPNCEWGMWTNGKYKEVLRKITIEGKYTYQEYNDIPPADGLIFDFKIGGVMEKARIYLREVASWSLLISVISGLCLTGVMAEEQPSAGARQALELVVQTGHTSMVTSVSFSPDGRYIVTGR